MPDFAYGDTHAIMRDQIIQEKVHDRILKKIEADKNMPKVNDPSWSAEDEPIVI